MITVELTEGWTAAIDMQLVTSSGAFDVTGGTVDLVLRDKDGQQVTTSSNVQIFTASQGVIRFNPDAGDLQARRAPYSARYRVTDAVSKVAYFPSGKPDRWEVYRA